MITPLEPRTSAILGGSCPRCGRHVDSVTERVIPRVRRLCEPPALPDEIPGSRIRTVEPCGCEV